MAYKYIKQAMKIEHNNKKHRKNKNPFRLMNWRKEGKYKK